jgi:hypothetical protein
MFGLAADGGMEPAPVDKRNIGCVESPERRPDERSWCVSKDARAVFRHNAC